MFKKANVWKDIIGFEGIYKVSENGNIINSRGMIMKPSIVGDGYLQAHLCKNGIRKHILVHHLVADHFLEEKRDGRNLIVDHKDNNKLNNHYTNLQIVTQRVNNSKDQTSNSKYTGVCWEKSCNKWRSEILINGKRIFLGRFDNEYDAHIAYQNKLKTINI